ncbi:MAG: hypothetical protein GWN93_02865 [Deltaproteobacteria bacterium]|nr:hypothetical protein [Deltaproteobacteria bacterium]
MYPYRIRIIDPILIDAFKQVSKTGYTKVDKRTAKRIGYKIPKKIKRDGVIIHNGDFGILGKKLTLTFEPAYGKRKGFDFWFKSIF